MMLILYTAWTVVLFSFAMIAFLGVRHARHPVGIAFAAAIASILVVSGFLAFGDMASVWTGYPVGHSIETNFVTLLSFALACLKSASWIADVRG